jgi:hypothetical protein
LRRSFFAFFDEKPPKFERDRGFMQVRAAGRDAGPNIERPALARIEAQ